MNELLDAAAIDGLRGLLAQVAPETDWTPLVAVVADLDPLALRARADVVAAALLAAVSDDRDRPSDPIALATRMNAIVRAALAERTAAGGDALSGWTVWPIGEAVVTTALAAEADTAFDDALQLLAELTPRLTSEFPIRRLLAADLDRALAAILPWTGHEDEHVRRLASEGTRSYLPWAIRVRALIDRPEATLPILDALRADGSEYVRRSVANSLNDLARHAPGLVVETAERWLSDPAADADTRRLVRHGLRTLVKKADPGALALLGFAPAALGVADPVLAATLIELPGSLDFSVEVRNDAEMPAQVAVDYVVHYRKANGSTSEKVFKLGTRTLAVGETRRFDRRHALRQMTTRVHHAGTHALEIQVNGVRSGRTDFEVVLPDESGRLRSPSPIRKA